jgi:hypothetical protein
VVFFFGDKNKSYLNIIFLYVISPALFVMDRMKAPQEPRIYGRTKIFFAVISPMQKISPNSKEAQRTGKV